MIRNTPLFDQRIADWLEADPSTAPTEALTTVVAAIRSIPQARRGRFASWRHRPMSTSTRLAIAAVVAAVVIGGAIFFAGSISPPTPAPSPGASPRPSSGTVVPPLPTTAAGQTFSPTTGEVTSFLVPFSYELPAPNTIIVGQSGAGFWQFRVPDPVVPNNYTAGLIVRAPNGGRVDPCREDSEVLAFDGGAQSVMDYLATVPRLTLSAPTQTTVGGLPALRAELRIGKATADCENVWLWSGVGSITENGGGANATVPIWVVDVHGQIVVLFTVAPESFWPTAQQIVDSIEFTGVEASG